MNLNIFKDNIETLNLHKQEDFDLLETIKMFLHWSSEKQDYNTSNIFKMIDIVTNFEEKKYKNFPKQGYECLPSLEYYKNNPPKNFKEKQSKFDVLYEEMLEVKKHSKINKNDNN